MLLVFVVIGFKLTSDTELSLDSEELSLGTDGFSSLIQWLTVGSDLGSQVGLVEDQSDRTCSLSGWRDFPLLAVA